MRARMTLGFAVPIAVLMALMCGSVVAWTHYSAQRAVEKLLDTSAVEVAREANEKADTPENIGPFLQDEGDEMEALGLSLLAVDSRGKIVAQPKSRKHAPPWPILDAQRDEWRVRSIPWGAHTLILAAPWEQQKQKSRELALLLAGVSVVVVAASGVGAWLQVGRTLSPIGQLVQQAKRAAADDLSVRLHSPSPDTEVAELVDTLNGLLERQAHAAQAKERFYATASHELRTPLQALSGYLEWGLSRPRPPEELEKTLREAQEQSNNLINLVQELLLLNQLDMATTQPTAQEVDVPDVAERVVAQLQPKFAARGLSIAKQWEDAGEIYAPSQHVEMLVRNLLDNAIKYATPGSEVRLSWDASTWAVWNECEPIEGWGESKFFEPFFRPTATRLSATGGNGLGLPICKALCQANGWHIELQQETSPVSGVRVCVRMK
jgi:signal transduction histidine kinase